MKKISLLFLSIILVSAYAVANPKHEFRATWLTNSIDWPKTTNIEIQKEMLCNIFDIMALGNMNAACLHVRSACDAMYKSSYEPWSESLTGTRGGDPGYDPLAFAIEEAHKRGIELHVWINPFRATTSGVLDTEDPVWKNAGQWIIKYNSSSFSGQIIDPGYPEAREYVHKVMMEIVNNYDIDGVVMDDYFYAYGGTTTQDADSKAKHKPSGVKDVDRDGNTDDDWRRANVDSVICNLYKAIQEVKPWVRFGMGTPGNWTMKSTAASAYGISLPAGIRAMDAYDYLYCNPIEWAKQGWVDYLNPQIYWSTQVAAQDYDVLCAWWAKYCEYFSDKLPNGQRVHFFPSQAAYCAAGDDNGMAGYGDGVVELQRQLDANRRNLSSGYTGSVFFNTSSYIQLWRDIKKSHFQLKALPPAMDWKSKNSIAAPSGFSQKDTVLSWSGHPAERYTIYAYPKEMQWQDAKNNPEYLRGIQWGNQFRLDELGDISLLTIAVCSYDRYGVEHEVGLYNGTGIFNPQKEIFWELNGGYCEEELPDYIREDYILPAPIKDNNEFGGWYKTKTFRGKPLTMLTAGWKGTLYAKWTETHTALPNISMGDNMQVYDSMGRYIGGALPTNQHGVFIIIQGENNFKIVL